MKSSFEQGLSDYRTGKKKKKTVEASDAGRLAKLRKRVGGN